MDSDLHDTLNSTPSTAPDDLELLTANEVARLLKCSRAQIYKLRSLGLPPRPVHIFPGVRGARWIRQDVLNFIREIRQRTEEPAPRKFVPIRLVDTG